MSAERRTDPPVVVVTGGARGIGRAIVDRFLSDGWVVHVVDVNEKAIASIEQMVADEPRLEVTRASVADRGAMQPAVDAIIERDGGIDALVNNAGMTLPGTFLDQDDAAWARVVEANLTGTFVTSQVVARAMVDAGSGSIVNIGSVSAHGVRTGPPAYAAAKAGIEGLSRLMAIELGPAGIRVNTVVVGTTATPWLLGRKSEDELDEIAASTLTGRVGSPEDVAGTVAFLCSDDAGHVTGQLISVAGGQWLP